MKLIALAVCCVALASAGPSFRGMSLLQDLVVVSQQTCDSTATRTDCHIDGQGPCEAGGCCWSPVNPNPSNLPWCFKPSGPAPPVPGGVCNAGNRTDCKIGNQADCESGGCCWSPVSPNPSNLPWCFFKTQPSPACSASPPCSGHGSCTNGSCTCATGYATCGTPGTLKDCSVDTTNDVDNCGACGNTCPSGTGVTSSSCVSSKCSVTCASGYIECYGECVQGSNCSSSAPFTDAEISTMEGYFVANLNVGGQGGVVASPSTTQPDYYYHWQRDAGISMRVLQMVKTPTEVEAFMKSYMAWVHKVQFATDPNSIDVRGEPKFFLPDGTVFDKPWMRPQNDGCAVRSIALIVWANNLIAAGQKDFVASTIFPNDATVPGIARDMEYVLAQWNQDSGDPWEEVRGQVFFVKFVMRKALLDAAKLATALGYSTLASTYSSTAADIQSNIQSVHWNAQEGIIMEVPQTRELDSATHLGFLYGANGDGFLDPNSAEAQSSVAVLVSSFSSANYPDFSINGKDDAAGIPGLLVGRYLHDTYNGGNTSQPGSGNPWILCTAALADFYYRAANAHAHAGHIAISALNRPFWHQAIQYSAYGRTGALTDAHLLAVVAVDGTVDAATQPEAFNALKAALVLTGDGIMLRIKHHIQDLEFHCAEEINKDGGQSQGAKDLTWSYGTVLSAMHSRAAGNL